MTATLVLLTSVSWFGYLRLRDLENQAVRAEHSASLLKMQAARSARIAERVGRLTAATRQLQTLDDNSVVALMDDLIEFMPASIRLAGQLQLDRRGYCLWTVLQGTRAISQVLFQSLRRHPQIAEVRLQSVTVNRGDSQKNQGARFRLQVRLSAPLWEPPGEESA